MGGVAKVKASPQSVMLTLPFSCYTPPVLRRVELGVRVIDDLNLVPIAISTDFKSMHEV